MHAAIIDRGRAPEIAGTPITVYDVCDYRKEGRHPTAIALTLRISSAQVQAASINFEASYNSPDTFPIGQE
jgi:uncharacterized protein (DUF433 family)